MALEKSTAEDKIEIIDFGDFKCLQIRTATIIKDDGVEASRTFHRHTVGPNDDISEQTDEVKALAAIYFTDAAKAAAKKAQAIGTVPS
jgi:hypothetical protein